MNISGVAMNGARHVAMFKGRYKYIYGVDGSGRGFRWDGAATAESIGLQAPTSAVTIASSAAVTSSIAAVNLADGGSGYYEPPAVTFKGGGLADGSADHAKGQATIRNGQVASVIITSGGANYTSPPQVQLSGGRGDGATISVGVDGGVAGCTLVAQGAGYTNGATVSFDGVSGAIGTVDITDGKVTGVRMLAAGTGATTTATATIYAIGGGSGASVRPYMSYAVTALTVVSGGAGFSGRVNVSFSALTGFGASAYLTANASGALESPVITSRGAYEVIPTANANGSPATASAVIRDPMKGSYRCAIRYVDSTPESEGGPIPSSITEPITVDAAAGAQVFNWSWSNSSADARAAAVELWRSSANQAIVLYRVASLPRVDGLLPSTYTDTLAEEQLLSPAREGYAVMPITLPSGQLNAKRFGVPPTSMEDACWFQDRAWYGVSTDGSQPNSLLFSEIDEPESVPDVNEIVVQENTGDQDKVVGLIPYGAMMVIAQERHLYRMMYVSQPIIDASITLIGYRGLLNKRCWCSFEGAIYCVDSFGMYAFDGSAATPVSHAVDNYWRDGIIDFSKSRNFFASADSTAKIIRFHYCRSDDGAIPPRALCYSVATKSWWEEVYGQPTGAVATVLASGRQTLIAGGSSGQLLKFGSGLTDAGISGSTSIPYEFRTGAMAIVNEPTRQIGVLYKPTAATADLTVKVHYNGSSEHRPNAIDSDRGEGVKAYPSGVVIDLREERSALGDATGYATARYSGRANDRSAGSDRHLAVALSGAQSAAPVVIHGVTIAGVTA